MTEFITHIVPKIAYFEIDGLIDEFYFEWEDDEKDGEATQDDYDKWLLANAVKFFKEHLYELDNYLKLK